MYQNPACDCPRVELTGVTLQTDLIDELASVAAAAGTTVEGLIESAFSNVGGRICPCIRVP